MEDVLTSSHKNPWNIKVASFGAFHSLWRLRSCHEIFIVYYVEYCYKKGASLILCIRFRGIAKRPSSKYKSQPTPKREHQLLSSWTYDFWRIFWNKNQKVDASLCFDVCHFLPIGFFLLASAKIHVFCKKSFLYWCNLQSLASRLTFFPKKVILCVRYGIIPPHSRFVTFIYLN